MSEPSDQPAIRDWMRPFLLGVKPPERPVTRLAARCFVRALLARTLLITSPGWILASLVGDSAWIPIAGVMMMVAGIADLIYLTISIGRMERAGES